MLWKVSLCGKVVIILDQGKGQGGMKKGQGGMKKGREV